MADIELRGSLSRIRKCAYELLSIEDLMDDEDSWDLIASDLRLKSTFLFCDFKQLISHSSEEKKFSLTEIANRLFYYIQELDHALQICSVPLMLHRYNDTALVLHEVFAAIMPEEICTKMLSRGNEGCHSAL